MFKGVLRISNGVSGKFQELINLKGLPSKFQGFFKDVSRMFQECFNDVSRRFQGCLKKVSIVFQENFIKSFKGVSSFVLQFCCSMNLIAATRAEGGLV